MSRLRALGALARGRRGDGTIGRFVLLSGGNLLASVFGFLVVILIVRAAGAGALGIYSFGLTVAAYATVVATLGTEYHAIRMAAPGGEPIRVLVPSVVLLRLLLAVPIYAAILGLALGVPALAPYRDVLAILGLALVVNAGNLIWLVQGTNRAWIVVIATAGPPLCTLVLGAAAAAWGFGAPGFAAGKIAADLLIALLLLAMVRGALRSLDWPAGWRDVARLARACAPIGVSHMLRGLALSSDLIVLGLFVSSASLGHYAAAFRIFNLALSTATMYHIVIIPVFAPHAADRARLAGVLRVSVRHTLTAIVPGVVVAAGLAALVLSRGFGADFVEATRALQLLAVAAAANVFARPYRQVLLTVGMQAADLRLNAISCGVHLALKVALCAAFGLTGVAAGTAFGELSLAWLTRRTALRALVVSA